MNRTADTISDRLKKFEQEHKVSVSAQDARTFRIVNARIPKKRNIITIRGKTFQDQASREMSSSFKNYEGSDAYVAENRGTVKTFNDFVKKLPDAVPDDKEQYDLKKKEGYGTSCD